MYIEPNTWTWTMICLNGDIFRDTYLECRSPHIHYYQACSGSLVQHLDLDLSARNWRKDRYTCTCTINNYYIRSHYQMIGGILGSIWGVQIFCHEKVQNNMWCSSFFITDGCNSTSQIQKMDFFKETILVRPLKLAIFLSTDDNNDITEDLYMISFWN